MDEELTEFLDMFFDYVFTDLCNCVKKECNITDIDKNAVDFYNKFIKKSDKTSNCNSINSSSKKSVKEIIEYFIKYGLLTYDGNKYYILNSHKRFNWKNIKQIDAKVVSKYIKKYPELYEAICLYFSENADENKFILYIKYIYWYFRKCVIDTMIGGIIKYTQVSGLSVGSTKIDSDYDITLYGSYTNIFQTINTFNTKFEKLFKYSSEIIFDTNIYGASFITSNIHAPLLNDHECGTNKFSVSDKGNNKSFFITQHIWAFVKVLLRLESLQNEIVYDFLNDTLYNSSDNIKKLLLIAEEFINKYEYNPVAYDKIVSHLDDNENPSDGWKTNYISFVNYNGSETYFTRGAFIDVVVNAQMCNEEYIKLTEDEYFDSCIENISELLSHFTKDKYIIRVKKSLSKLNIKNKDEILDILDKSYTLQNTCKNVSTVLTCSKFLLLYNYINCIVKISDEFLCCINQQTIDDGISLFKYFASKFPTNFNMREYKSLSVDAHNYTPRSSVYVPKETVFTPRSSIINKLNRNSVYAN